MPRKGTQKIKSSNDGYKSTKDLIDKTMKSARREIGDPTLLVKVINSLNDIHTVLEAGR